MVVAIDLGPYGIPPAGAERYTVLINGKSHRLAFIIMSDEPPSDEPPSDEQLHAEPGEPEYWH
jgi:hypothetical protein